jgi:enoyl-CoA hydratase/carnithine racemase
LAGQAPFSVKGPLAAGGMVVELGKDHKPFTLSRENLDAIAEALSHWECDGGLRWIALRAASKTTFLAGADLRELASLDPFGALAFSAMGQRFLRRLKDSRLWLVCCIEGACMGGGLDFALACDYRVAAPSASFAHPGPRLGLFTGWGGTASLPRLSGAGISCLLEGRTLSARQALREGWVEEVASDPLKRAVTRARSSATADLSAVKRFRRGADLPLSSALSFELILGLETPPRA